MDSFSLGHSRVKYGQYPKAHRDVPRTFRCQSRTFGPERRSYSGFFDLRTPTLPRRLGQNPLFSMTVQSGSSEHEPDIRELGWRLTATDRPRRMNMTRDCRPGVTLALPLCHRLSFWRVSPATGGAFFAVRSPGRINSHLRLLRRIFASSPFRILGPSGD